MELFEKRVKSRFGYNIISVPAPSFDEYKQRVMNLYGDKYDEQDLHKHYMISTDARYKPNESLTTISCLCVSEVVVLLCIIRSLTNHPNNLSITPQTAYGEYVANVRGQLDSNTLLRPLTIGQFYRAMECLIERGLLADRKVTAMGDFEQRNYALTLPMYYIQEKLTEKEPFIQRLLQ